MIITWYVISSQCISQLADSISFVVLSPVTTFHLLNMFCKKIPTLNKTLDAQPAFRLLPILSYFELFQTILNIQSSTAVVFGRC